MAGGVDGSAYSVSGEAATADVEQLLPGMVSANEGEADSSRQGWKRAGTKATAGVIASNVYFEQSFATGRRLKDLSESGERRHARVVRPTGRSTACCGCQPLNPNSNKRLVWDVLLVFLLLYVACIVPTRIAFDTSVKLGSALFWFESGVDMFFVCDIVLNFRTSLVIPGEFGKGTRIDDKRAIAIAYMKGWFTIDFIAVLPYSYIELVFSKSDTKSGSTQQVFKAMRLVRLAKLLRLTKMLPLLRRLDDKFEGLLSTSKLLSTMFVVIYITHLVGCAWYAVGNSDEVLPGNQSIPGWVSSQEWSDNVSTTTRWLRSFYWAMTTLTTVGFGDISPSTQHEMFFGCVAELFGTIVFGTLVGTVGSIISTSRKLEERQEGEIAELKEFMRAKHFPPDLQRKVKKYLMVLFKQTRAFDEKKVMAKLPPNLAFELMDHLYGERIKKVPLFHGLPEDVVFEMCGMLLPYPAEPGDYIYHKRAAAREMFIVNQGEVVLTSACDQKHGEYDELTVEQLEADIIKDDADAGIFSTGHVFGEEALDFQDLVEVRRDKNAIALSHVSMSMLRTNMIEQLAKKYPVVELEVKKFQARRAAALSKQKTDVNSSAAAPARGSADEVRSQPVPHDTPRIDDIMSSRAGQPTYASAGGPAQEAHLQAAVDILVTHVSKLDAKLTKQLQSIETRLADIESAA